MNQKLCSPMRIRPSRQGERGRFMTRENIINMLATGHAADVTDYAMSAAGYCGRNRVVVMDGFVITHRWMHWPEFLEACRRRQH